MIALFRNNMKRLLVEKGNLITSFIFLFIALFSAIYISNKAEIRANFAVVGIENKETIRENKYINIEYLETAPKTSSLVRGKYDAIVTVKDNNIEIETLKDDEFKEKIMWIISNPDLVPPEDLTVKKVGSNILSFMLLFILFQGLTFGNLVAVDREKHIMERICTTPLRFSRYILGNLLFSFTMIFTQVFFVVSIASLIGMNIGFNLLEYAFLISLISLLSVSISALFNSIFKTSDSYMMFTSSIIVLTTILTGSFSNFAKNETIIHKITYIFPQKDLIKFLDAFERNNIAFENKLQLAYILFFIVLVVLFSIFKMKKDYGYKK